MAKNKKPKAVHLPTSKEMEEFSKKFGAGEWELCSASATFCEAVETDLKKAEIYAVKILGELWDWVNDAPYDT